MLDTIRRITDEQQLREIVGTPAEQVVIKITDRLNDLTRQFIDASPFVCVATASPDGGLDVSPRGDPAGFVHTRQRTRDHHRRPGAAEALRGRRQGAGAGDRDLDQRGLHPETATRA
jgi:hypothetical protein